MNTLFHYIYRDAGNFKSHGVVVLEGELTERQRSAFIGPLESGVFFIAEQIGVPPLYQKLYQWSDGMIASDHCWHEFRDLEVVGDTDVPPDAHRWGNAADFSARVASVTEWDGSLSPHFWIGA